MFTILLKAKAAPGQMGLDFGMGISPSKKKKKQSQGGKSSGKKPSGKKGLVPKKVMVTNSKGTSFYRTVWVKPEEMNKEGSSMPQPTAEQEGLDKLREFIKEHGGKDKLKDILLKVRQIETEGEKSTVNIVTGEITNRETDKILSAMVKNTGLSRSRILQELGIREKGSNIGKKPKKKTRAVIKKEADSSAVDIEDETLNPNSENYRYKDTGYIGGSRKELAAQQIRDFKKAGAMVRTKDVDWESIESNPREARELIVKSNLFGVVPWDDLKAKGMDPAAGFLIDRVYASIGKEPEDSPEARKDYVYGIESIRDRMEKCTSVEDVTNTLKEMKDEYLGIMLDARESEIYKSASDISREKFVAFKNQRQEQKAVADEWHAAMSRVRALEWDREKRNRRNWKPDPELEKEYKEAVADQDRKHDLFMKWRENHPETKRPDMQGGSYVPEMTDEEYEYRIASKRAQDVLEAVKVKNIVQNPTTRAWHTLGDRFINVLNYRTYKGSNAFQSHVTTAKRGKIQDWSWAEKEGGTVKKETQKAVRFQLRVAEKFDRIGGRGVSVQSTAELKDKFNLREVQSGNWVLKDPTSAKFHTERSAEAFADLADLIGIKDEQVSMNGRLALAFGARGKGNAGFAGAARAHYEPVQRVINITKMGGGGTLAHEWFHSLDNLLSEASGETEADTGLLYTETPDRIKDPELRSAVTDLVESMTKGNETIYESMGYTDKDYRDAEYNFRTTRPGSLADKIKKSGDVKGAFDHIEEAYSNMHDYLDPDNSYSMKRFRRMKKQKASWVRITAAYYGGKASGGSIKVPVESGVSSFKMRAAELDTGKRVYWASNKEMAARAFSAYVEDALEKKGQKNDYLAVYSDNKYYKDPMFGDSFPFPEGEEREKINKAMEKLFQVISKRNLIQKALSDRNRLYVVRMGR